LSENLRRVKTKDYQKFIGKKICAKLKINQDKRLPKIYWEKICAKSVLGLTSRHFRGFVCCFLIPVKKLLDLKNKKLIKSYLS
jgi:hypothetical protein